MGKTNRETSLDFLAALSLVNLGFISEWRKLLYATGADAYFVPQPSLLQTLAPIAVVLGVAGVITAFLHLARGARTVAGRRLFRGAFMVAGAVPALSFLAWVKTALAAMAPDFVSGGMLAAAAGLLVLVLTLRKVRHYKLAGRGLRLALLVFSPYVLITFSQLVVLAAQAPPPRGAQTIDPVAQRRDNRVIWIVFDELDQRLVFEDRPSGLTLPAFDRLRGESVVADQVLEPGRNTLQAIPALLAGKKVFIAKPESAAVLLTQEAEGAAFEPFDPARSLFGDLAGTNTRVAIAGYYHPYCRLFSGMYGDCRRYPDLGPDADTLSEVLKSYVSLLPRLRRFHNIDRLERFFAFIRARAIGAETDFLFAHVPVPHWPVVYDAGSGGYTPFNFSATGYFDNVVLADRFLGDLRRALEAAGMWDSTHLIVTSDHRWRLARDYDGKEDHRVPYMVKLAGSSAPLTYSEPFDVLATADLVRALLAGEIADPPALTAWMDRRPR